MSSKSTEVAWAAGFFDGEGSSYIATIRGKAYPYVEVVQNERQPLARFIDAIGFGKITKHSAGKAFRVRYGGNTAIQAMQILLPYLSDPKVSQWSEVLSKART